MDDATGRPTNGRKMTESAPAPGETPWVIPSEIPITHLKSKDLEECVYWLLDAMGAKDLEWRVGGSGDGAADGGRDLEARFFSPLDPTEEGEQRWWVECKGRKNKTLEKSAVVDAVNNALAYDITHLLIVTNTQFSNPTRDWVSAWQKKHPIPKILLWDGTELERRLCRHPDVVMRLFSSALSMEGKLKALEGRFWNRLEFAPPRWLPELWRHREALHMELTDIVALTVNEFANGDIGKRPWIAALDAKNRQYVLHLLAMNIGAFAVRAGKSGAEQGPIIRSVAYGILCALEVAAPNDIAKLLDYSVTRGGEIDMPDAVWGYLLGPVFDQLHGELQDVCASDCQRIMWSPRDRYTDDGDPITTYWQRAVLSETQDHEEPQQTVHLESLTAPCNVGFDLNETRCCPLFDMEITQDNAEAFLEVAKHVITVRKAQFQEGEASSS